MKNQLESILNIYDINDIIRKVKFINLVLDNLIIENERGSKNIRIILNNIPIEREKIYFLNQNKKLLSNPSKEELYDIIKNKDNILSQIENIKIILDTYRK